MRLARACRNGSRATKGVSGARVSRGERRRHVARRSAPLALPLPVLPILRGESSSIRHGSRSAPALGPIFALLRALRVFAVKNGAFRVEKNLRLHRVPAARLTRSRFQQRDGSQADLRDTGVSIVAARPVVARPSIHGCLEKGGATRRALTIETCRPATCRFVLRASVRVRPRPQLTKRAGTEARPTGGGRRRAAPRTIRWGRPRPAAPCPEGSARGSWRWRSRRRSGASRRRG
jgi:hypothetical protein